MDLVLPVIAGLVVGAIIGHILFLTARDLQATWRHRRTHRKD